MKNWELFAHTGEKCISDVVSYSLQRSAAARVSVEKSPRLELLAMWRSVPSVVGAVIAAAVPRAAAEVGGGYDRASTQGGGGWFRSPSDGCPERMTSVFGYTPRGRKRLKRFLGNTY